MMSNSEYNKLEEHFKFLAQNPRFDYQQDDWSALAARLDEDNNDKKLFIPFRLFGLFGLVLVLIGMWFWASSYNAISAVSSQKQQNHSTSIIASKIQSVGGLTSSDRSQQNSGSTDKSAQGSSQASSSSISSVIEVSKNEHNKDKNQAIITDSKTETRTSVKRGLKRGTDNTADTNNNRQSSSGQPHAYGTEKQFQDDMESTIDSTVDITALKSTTALNLKSLRVPIIPKLLGPISNDQSIELKEILKKINLDKPNEQKSSRPHFLVNLNAGVEISRTPLGELSDTDYSFGIKLGYITSNKFVLTAGANYISECYLADGEDYSPPTGFWQSTDGVAPESVLAVCEMIDLSLGGSYYFKGVTNNGFSAHLNLNSNFMLQEDYYYIFSESGDNWESSFDAGNRTLLSNIEVATSYKLQLSKHLSVNAGPYIKIPTSGIGHGEVRLSSFGFRMGISIIK